MFLFTAIRMRYYRVQKTRNKISKRNAMKKMLQFYPNKIYIFIFVGLLDRLNLAIFFFYYSFCIPGIWEMQSICFCYCQKFYSYIFFFQCCSFNIYNYIFTTVSHFKKQIKIFQNVEYSECSKVCSVRYFLGWIHSTAKITFWGRVYGYER